LAGSGSVAYVRGYVHPLALLSRVFETVASHTPSAAPARANASPAPHKLEAPVPEIVVPESLVSASARDGGTTDGVGAQPRDTEPDDGLHPKLKADVDGTASASAVEVDALSRSIDRSTQAKLDSVERARLAAKMPVIRKP
ncbi:MAG: hypothetical protein HOQ09_11375, partial [Gemmatimonadaceae bacterium]|nr:hypothetical protein [Gemmatimonadaceae bacterium]